MINNNFKLVLVGVLPVLICFCTRSIDKTATKAVLLQSSIHYTPKVKDSKFSPMEQMLIDSGLVDIALLDSSIIVDLKYASTDNFMKMDLYGDLDQAFLQPDVALKLVKAQQELKKLHPDYSLVVYDAVRPRSIQQRMWDSVKMPIQEKVKFIANPKNASLHNFGAAVDVSIVDLKTNCALDMGVPFDFIGEEAHPEKEELMLQAGKITQQHIDNRKLLRLVMGKGGFFNIHSEWWHFNSCKRDSAYVWYKLIE